MLVIVVALHCEAKPIKEALSLSRSSAHSNFEIYYNDDLSVIVSGIGKIRSAIATSIILSSINFNQSSVILNLGISAGPQNHQIGDAILVNQLVDNSSGKRYHPDILIKHPFKESSLRTFDSPQSIENFATRPEYLADMEASGFFEAASLFLPPSQIQIVKVISDHFNTERPSKEFVSKLVSSKLDQIISYIVSLQSIFKNLDYELSLTDKQRIEKVSKHLKFTSYQLSELYKLAKGSKIRTSKDLAILDEFLNSQINSKSESKLKFQQIKDVLQG